MFVRALVLSLLAITPLFGYAANIVINPVSGFSDATATSAIGGNPGLTLGAQRLNTFQKAADILETFLDIQVDVKVDAAFSSLSCSAGSAVLGSAGASGGYINQANAPLANTIYPVALANNLALSDLNSTNAEISATFNADIDNNANCLNGVDWYYGYDDPALAGADYVNDTSFLSVVIHELLHGLGVTSWVQSNGALNSGFMDAYSANLYDQSTSKTWSAMNDSERLSSMTNTNNLVWTGTNVNTSSAASALSDGINSGKVEMYAPNPYEGGSSVSHFSTAATPNEIMEPSYTEFLTTPGMATQLLQDIGWAVPATNNAPILAAIGAQSSLEDNNKIITLSATDADSDTVSFSASSDNGSVTSSVSGTTLTLTPAANYFGTANITITANDGTATGNATDSEIFVYTINSENDLPVFTSANSGSTQYGNNLGVTLSATDIETANSDITFAVQSSNTSQVTASISGASLTLTPVNNYLGDTTITLRATDSNSGTTDQSYVLTITAIPNTAPVLTAIGAQSSTEDNAKIITLAATDGEGDALTYAASSDNASVTASVSGTILTLTPAANYFGSADITVSVTDGSLSDTEIVTYTINSENDLPVFTSSASGSIQYGNNLGVTLSATDIETANSDITFAVQSSNTSQVTASISGASLTLTPVNNYLGDTTITLRATDSNSGTTDQSYVLTITAIPNTAPVLTAIGAQSSTEDNAKIITLAATDGEGDALTYSASSDNASVTASVSGTILTLTPAANYFGSADITVSVTDGSLSDTEIVTYTINSENDLPVFTSSASGSIQYGNNLNVTLSATDIETVNGDITFAVQSSNTSQVTASISGASLTLTPINDYLGDTTITLRATDSNSGTTDQSYVLTITATPNTAPVLTTIGAQSSTEDNAKIITLVATDGEGDALTYSASSDNVSVTASVSGTILTLTPAANYFGSADITVSVTDGSLSDTEIVTYTINSENDLPVFTSANSGSTQYGNNLGVTLTATDIETANSDITFAVQSSNTSQVTASISGASLTLTPVNNYLGDTTITLRATDSNSGTTDQSYVLTITATPNTAPVLTAIGAQSSAEDNAKIITLAATDGEGDALTYAASSDNASVTASVSGTILTLTPAANYFGSADITVSVTDGSLSDTEIVTYTINSENDLPVFTSSASGSIQYGNNLNVTLSATDIETANSDITFAVQSSNTSQVTASISGASLTLTPINDYIGDTTITLRATDSDSGITEQVYTLTITTPANDAPIFTSSDSLTTLYGNSLAHSLTAVDANSDELTFNVTSYNGAQINASLTSSVLTLQAVNDFTGNTSIEVSVYDGTITVLQTINLSVFKDFSLVSNDGSLSQGTRLDISNSTFEFTLGGGDNNYTVDVVFNGQSATNELLTLSAGSYSLAMPASGAFAGDYTITITDGNGESANFIIQRPLKISTNINQLISASMTQEMYIDGAPAGSVLDLHLNQGTGLLDFKIDNSLVTQVVAPDDASHFNRAVVTLDINDASEVSVINISADSALLPAGSASLSTLPFHNVELTVTDLSGRGINTSINIDDDRFSIWGLNPQQATDSLGNILLALPKDQATLISLSAENYQTKIAEVDTQLDQITVTLELLENPMTVSGSITTSNLNFASENPVVQLSASDGSIIPAQLSAITSSSVNYSITTNKLAFNAEKLIVTHGEIIQEVYLFNNQLDSRINIHIDAVQIIQRDNPSENLPRDEEPIVNTSTSAGNSFILLLSLLLLAYRRKQIILQKKLNLGD